MERFSCVQGQSTSDINAAQQRDKTQIASVCRVLAVGFVFFSVRQQNPTKIFTELSQQP